MFYQVEIAIKGHKYYFFKIYYKKTLIFQSELIIID